MDIRDLISKIKPPAPITLKKFRIDGDLAGILRDMRQDIGCSMQDLLIALITEGSKAYRRMKVEANAKTEEPPESNSPA